MPARLHIGTDVFDLPAQPPVDELVEALSKAFDDGARINVSVEAGGANVILVLNPDRMPYLAVDLDGTWIGFHSG